MPDYSCLFAAFMLQYRIIGEEETFWIWPYGICALSIILLAVVRLRGFIPTGTTHVKTRAHVPNVLSHFMSYQNTFFFCMPF